MKDVLYILVIILISVFFLTRKQKVITNDIVRTIMTYDTVYKTDSFHSISYIPKYKTITDTFWKELEIDTLKILADYFAIRTSNDTLLNDSSLFVLVNDTIQMNSIKSRNFVVRRSYPEITKTVVNELYLNGFYVGGHVGSGLGFDAEYLYNRNMFGAVLGLDKNMDAKIEISYKRKIK